MIRPAKIFEQAVKYQTEQRKKQAAETDKTITTNDAVTTGAQTETDGQSKAASSAKTAGEKKAHLRVPSVRPKIGTLL